MRPKRRSSAPTGGAQTPMCPYRGDLSPNRRSSAPCAPQWGELSPQAPQQEELPALTLELQQHLFQHGALLGEALQFLFQLGEAGFRFAEHPALKAGEDKAALGTKPADREGICPALQLSIPFCSPCRPSLPVNPAGPGLLTCFQPW